LQGFPGLLSREATDLFQNVREYPGLIWNHFKTGVFPLHRLASPRAVPYGLERITEGFLP
jgi:hypothetical protein